MVVLLAAVGHAAWYDFLTDDAFIFARYARSLVEGQGLVFNPGERVEGYTSLLWVALGAGCGRLGVDYVVALRALAAAGALACLALVWLAAPLVGARRSSPLTAGAALLVAANGSFACWSLSGLEATGYAAIVLAAALAVAEDRGSGRRTFAAGLALAACSLTRPEGVLVAAALVLRWLWTQRRLSRARAALLVAPVLVTKLVHVAWRLAYYGDWAPNTFHAKVGSSGEQLVRGTEYVAEFAAANGGIALWLLPLLLVWLYPARAAARSLSLVAAVLVAVVVLVGGDGQPMGRFMVPIVPLWALCLLAVASDLLSAAAPRADRRRAASAAIAALGVAAAVSGAWQSPDSRPYAHARIHAAVEVPRWSAVGRWLAAHAAPGASVACAPIGAIGYYSRLPVIDILGLTDAHIAHRSLPIGGGWAGHEKHDGPYVLGRRPTYLLLGNVQVLEQRLPFDSPYFVRPPAPAIRAREDDFFTRELFASYDKRIAEVEPGLYLHYLRRRERSESGAR